MPVAQSVRPRVAPAGFGVVQRRREEPLADCRSRLVAVVLASALLTTGMDEDEAPAGVPSATSSLLHLVESSSGALTAPFHATRHSRPCAARSLARCCNRLQGAATR